MQQVDANRLFEAIDEYLAAERTAARRVERHTTYWDGTTRLDDLQLLLLQSLLTRPMRPSELAARVGCSIEEVRDRLWVLFRVGAIESREREYALTPPAMMYCAAMGLRPLD
jgi:hypothetical protein